MTVTPDQQPRFFGIYRGQVFDANDPSKKGRLRIIVPAVGGGKDPLDWAMPCVPYGWFDGLLKPHVFTDNADTNTTETLQHTLLVKTPKAKDRVWVMFEAGDARRPVWMGTWI